MLVLGSEVLCLCRRFSERLYSCTLGIPWWRRGQRVCLLCGRPGFDPWVRKIPWRRKWQPTPVFLPGESHGWRSLVGYSPWGCKESDMTERLHFHFIFQPMPPPLYLEKLKNCPNTYWCTMRVDHDRSHYRVTAFGTPSIQYHKHTERCKECRHVSDKP